MPSFYDMYVVQLEDQRQSSNNIWVHVPHKI
jgi:hypothetical protein